MVEYKIIYTKSSQKDINKIKESHLTQNVLKLLELIKKNPYQNPPPYEKLVR